MMESLCFICSAVHSHHVRGHLPILQLVFPHSKGLPYHQDLLALGPSAHLYHCGLHWPSHHSCEQDACSKAAFCDMAWNYWDCGLHLSRIAALWRCAASLPGCNEEIHSLASGHNEENTRIFWYYNIRSGNECGAAGHALHLVLEQHLR